MFCRPCHPAASANRSQGQRITSDSTDSTSSRIGSKGASKGVFVTTSDFTKGALDAHRELVTQKRIVLINGNQLADLMIEHEVGVRTVQTVRVQRIDLDAYEDDET